VERVKICPTAIFCILLSTIARSSVKVEKIVPHECTQLMRIAVTLDEKPLSWAAVTFYKGFYSDGKPALFSVSTKENGVASVPKLERGDYRADVSFNGIRSEIVDEPVTTSLFLHVSPKLEITTVPVDLGKPARELWREDEAFEKHLDALVSSPVHDRLGGFAETIVDPVGAKVVSAKIWVVQRTLQGWAVLFRGLSDSNGRVAPQLGDGRFVAICASPGFRTDMTPFEVVRDGSGELRTVLYLAAATE